MQNKHESSSLFLLRELLEILQYIYIYIYIYLKKDWFDKEEIKRKELTLILEVLFL